MLLWNLALFATVELQAAEAQLAAPSALPPIPVVSPVGYLRKLIPLSQEDLTKVLGGKPESDQVFWRRKADEYRNMPQGARESRLRVNELRYLMNLRPTERKQHLAGVPEDDRPLIEERLKQWDSLPADLQRELLDNETTIQYFLSLEDRSPAQRSEILSQIPENDRKKLEQELDQWLALPQEQQRRMTRNFQHFFELPLKEKAKTLGVFSDEDRQEMEKTLRTFEGFAPQERAALIESFGKLASMDKDERDQFLKNAARWWEMSPSDRQSWRNLINLLPKPTPPIPGQETSRRNLPGESVSSSATNAQKSPALPGVKAPSGSDAAPPAALPGLPKP